MALGHKQWRPILEAEGTCAVELAAGPGAEHLKRVPGRVRQHLPVLADIVRLEPRLGRRALDLLRPRLQGAGDDDPDRRRDCHSGYRRAPRRPRPRLRVRANPRSSLRSGAPLTGLRRSSRVGLVSNGLTRADKPPGPSAPSSCPTRHRGDETFRRRPAQRHYLEKRQPPREACPRHSRSPSSAACLPHPSRDHPQVGRPTRSSNTDSGDDRAVHLA